MQKYNYPNRSDFQMAEEGVGITRGVPVMPAAAWTPTTAVLGARSATTTGSRLYLTHFLSLVILYFILKHIQLSVVLLPLVLLLLVHNILCVFSIIFFIQMPLIFHKKYTFYMLIQKVGHVPILPMTLVELLLFQKTYMSLILVSLHLLFH